MTLTPELRRFVRRHVRSGRCRSEDEVVLEVLRVWQRLGEQGLDDALAKIARGLDDARHGRLVAPAVAFGRLDRKIARARRARR